MKTIIHTKAVGDFDKLKWPFVENAINYTLYFKKIDTIENLYNINQYEYYTTTLNYIFIRDLQLTRNLLYHIKIRSNGRFGQSIDSNIQLLINITL